MLRIPLRLGLVAALGVAALALPGCGSRDRPRSEPAVALPLKVFADTGRGGRLAVPSAARARAWLGNVTRQDRRRAPLATPRPAPLDLPPPTAAPQAPAAELEPRPSLVLDDDLKAPIPRGAARLRLTSRAGRTTSVDLDVRIDESGSVSDVIWAAGTADSAAVASAIECALTMRFYPALQHGTPVAVWCRQRFAFGRNAPVEPDSEHP